MYKFLIKMHALLCVVFLVACVGPKNTPEGTPTQKTPKPGADHIPQILVWNESDFWQNKKEQNAFRIPNSNMWGATVAARVEQVEVGEGSDLEALLKQYNARTFDVWLVFSKSLIRTWAKLKLPIAPGRRVLVFGFDSDSLKVDIPGIQVEPVLLDLADVARFLNYNKMNNLINSDRMYLGPLESTERAQSDIHGVQEELKESLFPRAISGAQNIELAMGVDWSGWLRLMVLAKNNWPAQKVIGFNSGYLRLEMSPVLKSQSPEKAQKIAKGLESFMLSQLEAK